MYEAWRKRYSEGGRLKKRGGGEFNDKNLLPKFNLGFQTLRKSSQKRQCFVRGACVADKNDISVKICEYIGESAMVVVCVCV